MDATPHARRRTSSVAGTLIFLGVIAAVVGGVALYNEYGEFRPDYTVPGFAFVVGAFLLLLGVILHAADRAADRH